VAPVIFFIAAFGAIAGAVGVVWLRNPFYSVLALVGHLVSLAALFLLLRAEFVAAAQVVVYAGAVMVLYVFVVAYIGGEEPQLDAPWAPHLRVPAFIAVGGLFIELCIAVLGSGLQAIDSEGAPYEAGFGTPGQLGELLLTRFLLAFELASILLLVAAVGAVVLARRRRGVGDDEEDVYSVTDFMRPEGVGTMLEAAGSLPEQSGEAPKRPAVGEKTGAGS
jgi:NADH-quinone oxidoreductase subunit J